MFGELDMPECTTWRFPAGAGNSWRKTKPFRERKGFLGVANAARTRDLLNHNQMLYQLSYGHHSVVFSKLNSHNSKYIHNFADVCSSVCRDGIKWLVC